MDKLGKNEDVRLLDFIDQVRAAGNKRLIMTTREYMLAQARLRYERLARAELDVTKCVIELENYTRLDRAKILYNHVYFSALGPPFYEALLKDRAYMHIVGHRNYSPRIVETVTRLVKTSDVPPAEFVPFFVESLDKPETIWLHAYENQLQPDAQLILLLLAVMPAEISVADLRTAFNALVNHRTGSGPNPSAFTQALRMLEDNFISVVAFGPERIVRFHNPSIRDFVHTRLDEATSEYISLLDSAQFFDQVLLLANYGGLELRQWPGDWPPPTPYPDHSEREFPGLRLALSSEPQRLVNAFQRTFSSRECATRRLGHARVSGDNNQWSPESRARLVLFALRRLDRDPPGWLIDAIAHLDKRWQRGGADKDEALALLRELDRSNRAREDVVALKEWFLSTLDDAADYDALQKLRAVRPQLVDDAEFETATEDVGDVLQSEFEYKMDSAESAGELEGAFDDLSQLAEDFGLSLSLLIDLDGYNERLEELATREGYEDDRDWRDGRWSVDTAEQSNIDSLFDTLRGE